MRLQVAGLGPYYGRRERSVMRLIFPLTLRNGDFLTYIPLMVSCFALFFGLDFFRFFFFIKGC